MHDDERIPTKNEPVKHKYDPSRATMMRDGYEVLDSAKTSREFPFREDMRGGPRVRQYPFPPSED